MRNINIYTDGACKPNPGPGGYGWVIVENNKEIQRSHATGFRKTTNNRMEIRAVQVGLSNVEEIIRQSRDTNVTVTVYSDSQLVVNTIEKGYARKKNKDMWEKLDEVLHELKCMSVPVTFIWVRGHADNRWNNLADEIANKACQESYRQDTVFEEICKEETQPARPFPKHITEPEIVDVRFCNVRDRKNRRIEILLTNGTTVTILPCHGGFEQTGCTQAESAITVDIAHRFTRWLNGGKL